MANNNQNIKALKEALLEKLPSTRVREQELLCHHTTFKIGGPADLFIEPTTMDELSFTLRTIHELQVPVTIIGCGSNILVKDGGIRGAVVSVRHMTQIMDCNDNVLCIGSGYMLKDAPIMILIKWARVLAIITTYNPLFQHILCHTFWHIPITKGIDKRNTCHWIHRKWCR